MTVNRGQILVILCFLAFISLGLPDGLLGVAWPSMRADFGQPLDALGYLLVSTTAGYMISSFFSGLISRVLGIGRLLALSCAATGLSLLAFTLAPEWWMIIAIGTVIGAGAGAIDAGLNTYVATNHSERLMQWLHASFGIGITLGPLVMTAGLNFTDRWHTGYWIVGSAQLLLALGFFMTASLWHARKDSGDAAVERTVVTEDAGKVIATGPDGSSPPQLPASLRQSLRVVPVWLSMGLFFSYTGLELTVGLWGYSLLTESRGIPAASAGLWIGVYWGMFTLGRMVAGVFANRLGNHHLVVGALCLAMTAAMLLAWNPITLAGLLAIGLIGFAFAPIFPGMISGTERRVGAAHVGNTMGMQIAAAGIGAASLPALAGVLAETFSLEIVPYFVMVFIAVLSALYIASRRLADRSPIHGTTKLG